MKKVSVAIDGPGGSGKSTVARLLAKELNYIYIDTGAMYRAVALFCMDNGVPLERDRVTGHLDGIDIRIGYLEGKQRIFIGAEDVSEAIRTPRVAEASSIVAAFPEVREKLVSLQRELARGEDVIMDGRDIGTFVLPFADVKIYLEAGVEERARRRQAELLALGIDAEFEQTKKEVEERDSRDINRECSPLKRAEDAILIDSSHMTLDEVKNRIAGIIADRGRGTGDVL